MNKRIGLLLALPLGVGLFLGSTKPVAAQAQVQVGIVQGMVSNAANNPLTSAAISVTCNGNTLNTTTDGSGFYTVQFANGVCNDGQTAIVTATKGGETGSASGVLVDYGTIGILNLDIAVVYVQAVPEFGMVSGLFALVTSSGAFAFLRRKIA